MLDTDFLFREGYLVFDLESYDNDLYNELQNSFNVITAKNSIKRLRMDGTSDDAESIGKILKQYGLENYNTERRTVNINFETLKYESVVEEISPYFHHINQIWFFSPDDAQINSKLGKISDKINKKISKDLYNQTITTNCVSELTLYTKGCFIENHNDGTQEFRNCVILVYLNKNWKEEDGGEIILNDNLKIPPTFGKVVVLDFLHNNIEHAVNMVKNDFERYALIKFINKNLE